MALTFPASPTTGQTYTYNGETYEFDGKRWRLKVVGSGGGAVNADPYLTLSESGVTVATLEANAPSGSVSYVTDNGGHLYYKNASAWKAVTTKLGSIDNPAPSASAIITAGDSEGDGFYYIMVNGSPTQVWCDMTNSGGGWMLVMKTLGASGNFVYSNAYWTNTTTFNTLEDPTTFNGDIKTTVYTQMPFTNVRLCMGSIANGLVESTWSNTTSFATFMSSGVNSSNSRTSWLNWASAGGVSSTVNSINASYPNCNQLGTNKAYNYQYARIGGTFNNEGDCTTNDASVGFGLQGIAPYSNNHSCGGQTGHTTQTATGWIFVR